MCGQRFLPTFQKEFQKDQSKDFGHNTEFNTTLVISQFWICTGTHDNKGSSDAMSKFWFDAAHSFTTGSVYKWLYCSDQQWQSNHLWQRCQSGLLTSSFPSVLRWSLRPFLAEWFYHHHHYRLSSLLHLFGWRVRQAEVWCWMLAAPPDPVGYGHRSNRRHRDAHWNKENGW